MGNAFIFDLSPFYTPNEIEIRDRGYILIKIHDQIYAGTYLQHFDPCERKQEWDDRN